MDQWMGGGYYGKRQWGGLVQKVLTKISSPKEIFQRVRHMDERQRPLFPTKLGSKPQSFQENQLVTAVGVLLVCICKVGFAAEDDEPEVEVYNVDGKPWGFCSDCFGGSCLAGQVTRPEVTIGFSSREPQGGVSGTEALRVGVPALSDCKS